MAKVIVMAAMSNDCLIGRDNKLPWTKQREDLVRFKKFTMGYPMIMGRKTFESLPGILPGRPHIVITRNKAYSTECKDVQIAHSVEGAIEITKKMNTERIMICGGSRIYSEVLHKGFVDEVRLTKIHADLRGDTFFPISAMKGFVEHSSQYWRADEKNEFSMTFKVYKRT